LGFRSAGRAAFSGAKVTVRVATKTVHLSELRRAALLDPKGERLGRLKDVIVRLGDEDHPPVSGLKVRIGGRDLFLPLGEVAELEAGRVQLKSAKLSLDRFARREGEVLLVEDVLGRSLVFVGGEPPRLVRADDLVLGWEEGGLRLVGVVSGFAARLKRLPIPLPLPSTPKQVIDWREIDPFLDHVPTLRRRLAHRKLARLHPAEIADLVEAASPSEGEEIIRSLESNQELAADVFEELAPARQLALLSQRSDGEVAEMVARMAPDDAADLVEELEQGRRRKVLELLPAAKRRRLERLLGFNPATAGGLMNPEVVVVDRLRTVGEAIGVVRSAELPPACAAVLFLHDEDGRYAGSVDAVTLLRADPNQRVGELVQGEPVAVRADAEVPQVAKTMADYNLISLPVVDNDGRLLGAVSVDDVLELTIPEDWRRRYGVVRE
jgi:CBS domain-containing protein/sporulation protein YlmC with PRC-barrel domain